MACGGRLGLKLDRADLHRACTCVGMACGARLGLKLLYRHLVSLRARTCRNGLWSPFGLKQVKNVHHSIHLISVGMACGARLGLKLDMLQGDLWGLTLSEWPVEQFGIETVTTVPVRLSLISSEWPVE